VVTAFDRALAFVLGVEGGYNKADPVDRGGPTNFGIRQVTYDFYRATMRLPTQPVTEITREEAAAIYRTNYWEPLGCDDRPAPLDLIVFDTAVNHGPGRARDFLRDCEWADQPPGIIGFALLCLRRNFYRRLAENDTSQAKFLRGWLNRLDALRGTAGL